MIVTMPISSASHKLWIISKALWECWLPATLNHFYLRMPEAILAYLKMWLAPTAQRRLITSSITSTPHSFHLIWTKTLQTNVALTSQVCACSIPLPLSLWGCSSAFYLPWQMVITPQVSMLLPNTIASTILAIACSPPAQYPHSITYLHLYQFSLLQHKVVHDRHWQLDQTRAGLLEHISQWDCHVS